jgi:hypothetical protein
MTQVSRRHLGRRKVLVAVAAVGAGGLVPVRAMAGAVKKRGGPPARDRLTVPVQGQFSLLGHALTAGEAIGHGVVEAVLPVTAGAVPVVMRTPAGARFQVDVLRRDPAGPSAVAETPRLGLFIANKPGSAGDGRTPTDEAQAHAARSLARWLAEREADDAALMTWRERAAGPGVLSL